jgi:hypothetical protein
VRDSSRESSVVAGLDEQTDPADLQDQELAILERSVEAAWLPHHLVRSGHGLSAAADRHARQAAAVRQPQSSDAAIQTCLTMKILFGMALRQTTGFVKSMLRLVGFNLAVPDFSTLSRRKKTLAVSIPYRGSQGPLNLLIDSTGTKAEGKAEWHPRKQGGAKRRLCCKIHIAVDEQTLDIRAIEVTDRSVGDAPMLPELPGQIPADVEIGSVTADGAYDTRKCHNAIADRGADAVIPPHKNTAPRKPSPETRRCAHRSTSAAPSGENGPGITAKAAPRRNLSGSCCA